jgi:Amt family ammonium transporter
MASTLLSLAAFILFAPKIFAQSPSPGEMAADAVLGVNMMWLLITGFLVFFMQAGFALVETGFTRAKNAAHTMMMNMMIFGIGAFGYWLTGFAFQFGGINAPYPDNYTFAPTTLGDWTGQLTSALRIGQIGILGGSGFMLLGLGANSGILAFFLFQMVFMDTAATIPTGTMAERLRWTGFCLLGLWVSMFIYPLVGGWVWGGGWLANLGRLAGLGSGAVDFAGSGVVHMIGGSVALAGGIAIGPRIGKFNKDGSANTIPGHNIPLGALGTIILFFGWFGFNPGSSFAFTGAGRDLATNAAVNTLMAGAVSACTAMLYTWIFGPNRKPSPTYMVNGMLAGLVAITAPCAFVDSVGAVIIGAIAGVLVCLAAMWLEKAHVDDAVGAVPVHFVCGAWGLLSVGIFAKGLPASAGWNGVTGPVSGLIVGNFTQIIAQLAEIGAILVFALGLSLVFFKIVNALKLLRVAPEVEIQGLDIPEMGEHGYVGGDIDVPGGQVIAPSPTGKATAAMPAK